MPRHEDVLGNRVIAPRILNLGIRWMWVVRFTPRPLYPQEKIPRYPLDRGLGGIRSRSGRGGEDKKNPYLESNPDRPAPTLVAVLTWDKQEEGLNSKGMYKMLVVIKLLLLLGTMAT
jgi:hypothetical protein